MFVVTTFGALRVLRASYVVRIGLFKSRFSNLRHKFPIRLPTASKLISLHVSFDFARLTLFYSSDEKRDTKDRRDMKILYPIDARSVAIRTEE